MSENPKPYLLNPKKRTYAPMPPEVERVGKIVLDSAFRVHTALGAGLLESAYRPCLAYEIEQNGLLVQQELTLPITYRSVKIDAGFRIDLLKEKGVIIELKAVQEMPPVFEAQILTYMKLAEIRLGYLINFNVAHLKDGITRIVR